MQRWLHSLSVQKKLWLFHEKLLPAHLPGPARKRTKFRNTPTRLGTEKAGAKRTKWWQASAAEWTNRRKRLCQVDFCCEVKQPLRGGLLYLSIQNFAQQKKERSCNFVTKKKMKLFFLLLSLSWPRSLRCNYLRTVEIWRQVHILWQPLRREPAL